MTSIHSETEVGTEPLVLDEDELEPWAPGPLGTVGRPAPRLDGHARARGEAAYTADVSLPGMLHAAILRSPYAHARVLALDLAPALAAPGVRGGLAPGELWQLSDEPGYVGAPVAAVAAETSAQARAALEAIDVEWEELEPILDPVEAVARGELVTEPRRYERGDVERGLAEADVVVEAEYRTQTVLHHALETHQAVCTWAGDDLTVYVSTQWIWGVRSAVALALDVHPDRVRVVCPYMGGGFGAKSGPGVYTLVAAELARRIGRPVRCALSRREESFDAGNRNATVQQLVAGAREDGTLTALTGEFVNAVGWSGWLSETAGPMKSLYACENVRTVEYGARVNSPPMSSFRAPGFTEGTFGLECLLDELAVRLSIDPLELRRRNYASEAADAGRPYSANNLLECYRRIEPYWNRRRDVRDRPGCRRGRGLAGQIWYGGGGPPAYAWIRVGSDGRAVVVTATQDIGTGTRTGMAQVAAEELGLPLDWIRVELGDTGAGPYGAISAGSSTISSMGPAVRSAAADAKRQVLELAARTLDRTRSELDVREGRVVASDGESWSIGRACGLRDHAQILGTGARAPNPAELEVRTFGVQLAEVTVDVETGEVQVDRVVAVHDVGRILNPLGARSQVEGGIIQAVGHTLSEQRLVDPQSGTVLTQTLDAYGLPTIADVPEIVCEFVDVPDVRLSALGAKGLGEPPVIPTAAAIANAIRDATGADVRSLPITRDVLLQALPREPSIAAGQPP